MTRRGSSSSRASSERQLFGVGVARFTRHHGHRQASVLAVIGCMVALVTRPCHVRCETLGRRAKSCFDGFRRSPHGRMRAACWRAAQLLCRLLAHACMHACASMHESHERFQLGPKCLGATTEPWSAHAWLPWRSVRLCGLQRSAACVSANCGLCVEGYRLAVSKPCRSTWFLAPFACASVAEDSSPL